MADITDSRFLYAKGVLFVLAGLVSSLLIILERPTLKVALLLGVSIWCFARAYYFAFYVIQRYVDPSYKFSGLLSFARYLLQRRQKTSSHE